MKLIRSIGLLTSLICVLISLVEAILPIVVWHALGSSCCDESTSAFISLLKKNLPKNAQIIPIRIGKSASEDENRSYFDDANRQVDEVCRDLRQRKELQGGFNAVGLSQGGLLFRALVEKCNGLRVNNLITLGSPLQGVAAYPGCGPDDTFTSQGLNTTVFRSILRKNQIRLLPCPILKALIGSSVYSESVQGRIMPAQYFKDPNDIPQYLQANRFLADINNEHGRKNQRYKDNMVRLKTLVVFSFTNDVIVYPKESTNLGYFENGQIRPLRELRIYKEDWIGLKTLDQRKALIQIRLPGEHLDFNKDNIKRIVPYLTEA